MTNKGIGLKDKHFYFLIFLVGIYFIIRLIDEYKIVYYFPLAENFDLAAHLGILYLTANYSFHSFVPLWYNGITLFQIYYPAWYYFTLPIYYIVKDVVLSTYLSFLFIFGIGFISVYFGLKELSLVKKIAFFLLFFANPIFTSYILRIGRTTEMFSWLIFIFLFFLLYYYIDKKIDYKFLIFFILIYAISLMSHYTGFFLSTSLILSFLLIRRNLREYSLIFLSFILFLLITSFWWVPFYSNIQETPAQDFYFSKWLISDDPQWFFDKLTTILTSVTFIVLLILYFFINKPKKYGIFFIPQSILAFLVLTRLIVYIPVLNRIPPDPYNILFIWCSLFIFFKLDFEKLKKFIKTLFILSLYALPVIMILFSVYHTPFVPKYTKEQEGIIELVSNVGNKFILSFPTECSNPVDCTYTDFRYYSYATIKYNLSSSLGGAPALISNSVAEENYKLLKSILDKDCKNIYNYAKNLGVVEIVGVRENCNIFGNCKLHLKKENNVGCVYRFPNT